jgi:hypothetical protein
MVDNLLPNTNWQLFTQLPSCDCAMNYQGTGTQFNISISSFDASNNNPNFYTSNTEQIEVGALVAIDFPAFGAGLTALRVNRVVPNSSFQCQLPFGMLSPAASFATTARPVSICDYEGRSAVGPDGWKKSASLVLWPDDFVTNACVGAKRVLGLRKQSDNTESLFWPCPTGDIRKFAGRTITFGALVKQKVQSGPGTWRLTASDSSGTSYSASGYGRLFNDPTYGGFEFQSVTRTASANTTDLTLAISVEGNKGDVYYVALPTAAFGDCLIRGDCGPNIQEIIFAINHWNPPLLTPLVMTFPTNMSLPGSNLYGFSGLDLEHCQAALCIIVLRPSKQRSNSAPLRLVSISCAARRLIQRR